MMIDGLKLYVYDLETFFDCFLFLGSEENSDKFDVFEVSTRRNQKRELLAHLSYLQNAGYHMVGFNNVGFDYEVIHDLLQNVHTWDHSAGYAKGQVIIKSNAEFRTTVRHNQRIIPQIDLYKINHFDNRAKVTSLKQLEVAMRLDKVIDLPFDPHKPTTDDQKEALIAYGCHDVGATKAFMRINKDAIAMRKELLDNRTLEGDVFNFSDVKIGSNYLISKIGRANCYSGSVAKSTIRESVAFKDVILPKIFFRSEPFTAVLEWFKTQTKYIGSEETPSLDVKLSGMDFSFGSGGIHASVSSKTFVSNRTHVIRDVDVAAMYPSIAIANGFRPEHLGQEFTNAYRQLSADRRQYAKGTTMNATLKLANNGAFGNSNNKFSPFYDPKFTFAITVNGQLQLLQLAEMLLTIPGLELIQCNTDGVTAFVPREYEPWFDMWTKHWENETGLSLEHVTYDRMMIRDVNNYIAIDTKGKVKRKGAYAFPQSIKDYEGWWNKDYSCLIAPKGASNYLIHGITADETLALSRDKFDFMLRVKARGADKFIMDGRELQKTVRYYVSTAGKEMFKISPPKGPLGTFKKKNGISDATYKKVLGQIGEGVWDERIHTKNRSVYEENRTAIEAGWKIKECNDANDFNWDDVNYDYYREQIEKLYI